MESLILDKLVKAGVIKHYELKTLDENGNEVTSPGNGMRETEQLKLIFPLGVVLVIDTFCSGSGQNTSLQFSDK